MAYDKSKMIRINDYGFTTEIRNDIYSRLRKDVTDQKERCAIVQKIFDDYQEMFLNLSEKNIATLNKSDTLSQDTALIQFYETFAKYIDVSKESRKEALVNANIREHECGMALAPTSPEDDIDYDYSGSSSSDAIEYDRQMLYEINEKKKSRYLPKDQVIVDSDYSHPAFGSVLLEYKNATDKLVERKKVLKQEMKEIREGKYNQGEYVKRKRELQRNIKICKDMKDDQISAKDGIGRTVYFKKLTPNTEANDWFSFVDYGKPEDVKVCLLACSGGFNTEKGIINHDLDVLIEQCGFTSEEMEILKHYRAGQAQEIIAKSLNKSQPHVCMKIDTMCNRISKLHKEQHYDNLRIHWVRGKYKKCIKCEEIKFEKDYYNGKNVCKTCRIKQQN